jgi:hypothetical protein
MKKNLERDAAIYAMFMSGKKRKQVAHEFEITDQAINAALRRHRELHNLPNGRKSAA